MMTAYQKNREEKPAHSASRKISVGSMNAEAVFRSDCLLSVCREILKAHRVAIDELSL